jgi:hypothetical protein
VPDDKEEFVLVVVSLWLIWSKVGVNGEEILHSNHVYERLFVFKH